MPSWSFAPVVRALQTLRGVDLIVAVTFVTEIGDVRRFESPRQLMGYLGLVPVNVRPVRRFGAVASPRPATDVSVTCWSKAPGLIGIHRGSVRRSFTGWSRYPEGARHRLESTDAPYGTLSSSDRARQEDNRGLHRHRTRARRLHVVGRTGGADRLNLAAHTALHLAHRRGRNHGRGNARQTLCGRPCADARCKIGTAPDAHSEMR